MNRFMMGFADELMKLAEPPPPEGVSLAKWDQILSRPAKKVPDKIKGGEAKGMPDELFDKRQLRMGIRIEGEHTANRAKRKEIAKDHLAEQIKRGKRQNYYTKLIKMEGN